ncbi:hypothetical protein ACFRGK_06450 [Bacillus subtilis]|uniref:hypothetical protein n=1 Tax=Bacillus TaxID=1386 RepID=UPI0013BB26F7|nr:hypothetical protein [Bacillus subtilis]KAF2427327.1 hypothetical protein B6K89_03855 [Bacillus subtilis]MCY9145687.1 hypothetical protein [Bacillus sp. T9C1]MEC0312064.1 hypothetical protein [Bacillus subtilis]MEC0363628.1 hypothetical protein [Bacillus subtilis]
MSFFNKDIELGSIKEVGNSDVVLSVGEEEFVIELSEDEHQKLQQHIMNQDNLLVPINMKTKELFLNVDGQWFEENMEELAGADERTEED